MAAKKSTRTAKPRPTKAGDEAVAAAAVALMKALIEVLPARYKAVGLAALTLFVTVLVVYWQVGLPIP